MVFFNYFLRQNLIRIYTKAHQIAPFSKNFLEDHAPKPLSQIPQSEKNLGPRRQILATLL